MRFSLPHLAWSVGLFCVCRCCTVFQTRGIFHIKNNRSKLHVGGTQNKWSRIREQKIRPFSGLKEGFAVSPQRDSWSQQLGEKPIAQVWYQDENCCLEDLYLNQQILSLNLYNSSSPTDTNYSYLLMRLSTNLSATWYAAPCALHVAISWVCKLVYPHGAVTITRVKQLNPLLLLLRKIVVSAGCIHPARNKGSTHKAGEKCWMMTLLLMFCPLCWRPQWNPSLGLVRGDALNWRTYTTYLWNHTERNRKNTALLIGCWISTDNFHTDQASLRNTVSFQFAPLKFAGASGTLYLEGGWCFQWYPMKYLVNH